MKKWTIVIGIAGAGLAFHLQQESEDKLSPLVVEPVPVETAAPSHSLVDPVEVFQKAFWKRPTAEDEILHAVRNEWADEKGIQRWEWFIVAKPSAALVKHLKEDNAFRLSTAEPVLPLGSPEWFTFPDRPRTSLGSASSSMQLVFSDRDEMLHATCSGGGFRSATPEQPRSTGSTPASTGRLPLSSPPHPSSQ